ncbi:MAG: hypothetical protein ACRD6U_10105, partial [Nitrososphaeraceae archaeon]
LANLIICIQNFNEEYDKLRQLIDEYKKLDEEIKKFKETELKDKPSPFIKRNPLEIKPKKYKISERLLKEKLRSKGWTNEEISYYYECQEGLYCTDIFLHEGIIKILLQKFLFILDNFGLNVASRKIINQIIIQIFQAELSDIVTNTHIRYTTHLNKKYKNNKIDYSQYYPNFKYEPLDYIDKLRFPFSLPVMEIVKKVMLFYLKLLDQLNLMELTEVIPLKIKSITLAIEDSPINPIHEDEISREDMRICCRCLITVYEKYLDSN